MILIKIDPKSPLCSRQEEERGDGYGYLYNNTFRFTKKLKHISFDYVI